MLCAGSGTPQALTLDARIALSGVCAASPEQRLRLYTHFLALLGSSVAQMPTSFVHDYFSKRPVIVADYPDGPHYLIRGDRTMLADGARPLPAAAAAYASRRAIEDLLGQGRDRHNQRPAIREHAPLRRGGRRADAVAAVA